MPDVLHPLPVKQGNSKVVVPTATHQPLQQLLQQLSGGLLTTVPPPAGVCWCHHQWDKAGPVTEAAVSLLHAAGQNRLHPTQTHMLISANWKLGTAGGHLLCIPGQVGAWSGRYPALLSGLATCWIWPSTWSPPPQHSSHSPHIGWRGGIHTCLLVSLDRIGSHHVQASSTAHSTHISIWPYSFPPEVSQSAVPLAVPTSLAYFLKQRRLFNLFSGIHL